MLADILHQCKRSIDTLNILSPHDIKPPVTCNSPQAQRRRMVETFQLYRSKYFPFSDQTELLPKKLVETKEEETYLPKEPYNQHDVEFMVDFNRQVEQSFIEREKERKKREQENKYKEYETDNVMNNYRR